MLKRFVLIVAAMALVVAVGLAGIWLWGQVTSPAAAQTTSEPTAGQYSPSQTITVVGQGSVRIEPDVARISIGVETSGQTVSDAVAENEIEMEAILEALEAAGIAEKDIQTMNYSIHLERYPEPYPGSVEEGGEAQPQYRVSNMVNVTVRDLESVGDVLDAVVEAGANNIWGVNFGLEDREAAVEDARADAIEDARARAGALAELSGVELGPVMSVSEVLSGGGVPMAMDVVERAAGGSASISPGELEIGYQVQVTYFIEQ